MASRMFFRTTFSTTATDINNLTRQPTFINGRVLPALILVVAESKVGFLVEKPSIAHLFPSCFHSLTRVLPSFVICAAGMSMLKDVLPEELKLVKDSVEDVKTLIIDFGIQYIGTSDGTCCFQFKAAAFETERLFTFMQKNFPKTSTSSQSPTTITMAAAATGRPERQAKLPENQVAAKVSGAVRFTSSPPRARARPRRPRPRPRRPRRRRHPCHHRRPRRLRPRRRRHPRRRRNPAAAEPTSPSHTTHTLPAHFPRLGARRPWLYSHHCPLPSAPLPAWRRSLLFLHLFSRLTLSFGDS